MHCTKIHEEVKINESQCWVSQCSVSFNGQTASRRSQNNKMAAVSRARGAFPAGAEGRLDHAPKLDGPFDYRRCIFIIQKDRKTERRTSELGENTEKSN